MGRNRFRGSQGSAGASRRRGDPFHVVVARKSDGPVANVPGSRVVHRFDLRGVVVPVSNESGASGKARHRGEGVGRGSGRYRC